MTSRECGNGNVHSGGPSEFIPTAEEITKMQHGAEPVWRKSSRSGTSNCVEVTVDDVGIGVRDSKHPHGPVLRFTHAEWAAFVGGVRDGEFSG
jgi:uncharacterized protein DUF397